MAGRKRRFRIGLIVLVTISLFVCPLAAGGFGLGGANAQIAFTPNVATLVWTQTVEGPGLELGATVEPGVTPVVTHIPVTDGAWIVEGLTSDEALERCSQRWGDEQRGMCLAPGANTYYVWIEPGTVMEVVIDDEHIWQGNFQDSVVGIVNDRDSIDRERWGEGLGWLAIGGGGLGLLACATVVGCVIGGVAFVGGIGEVVLSEATIEQYESSLCTQSRDAVFNYCMMQGNDDSTCRVTAGYDQPCRPRPSGRCNPRTPCMPQ